MAKLWIREYSHVRRVEGSGIAQIADESEGVVDQTPLTFSTSAASAAFGPAAQMIAIYADADFHYTVGPGTPDPTATTNHFPCKADTTLYLGVKPGQKIAAIAQA